MYFETLSFKQQPAGLQVTLLKLARTVIPNQELEKLGPYQLSDQNTIEFPKLKNPAEKFGTLLAKHLSNLKNKLTNNPVTYVHSNSGIPLIGNVAFGIVYRNSSIIEIKPSTSCNLNCIYCSVGEGLSSKRNDFIVEKDYLITELFKLLKPLTESVEIHVGVQGEPFLYADMEPLLKDLNEHPLIHTISIDTNGTLFTTKIIDKLSKFQKLQLNISLDAMDPEIAKKMVGVKHFNLEHLKKTISYAAEKINKVIVAPVMTSGYNEEEIEKILQWVKTLPVQPMVGIQNYLRYKGGRGPSKEISWEDFYKRIESWEKEYDIKLKLKKEDFNIRELPPLPKPFYVGETITAELVSMDRFSGSSLAASQNRNISVPGVEFKPGKKIKLKILA